MPNLLAHETSPYLQQHADNPVDWHAWNADALRLAREQDKPILLSIGYSACHWCHVMAHESFEDEAVAAVMNAHFINIKVDREERPDLDQIYQTAHHLLTQRSGGWPLTMFLSPDGTPFFGGTYFPKKVRHQLPAFPDLLKRVAQVYKEQRQELIAQGEHLTAALVSTVPHADPDSTTLNDQPLIQAVQQHKENYDRVNGGFGGAPKFLHPAELDLLLRRAQMTGDKQAQHIVFHTLQQMAYGGLYDQLGGGFCRYSVDERWDIPHFEKMLYDNGLLLGLYSNAWQSNHNPLFEDIVEQTATWVMREMQSPDGGYYSSLDADSEHEEGRFYVWQRDEVRELLSEKEYAFIAPYYSLDCPANFEHFAWNLRVSAPLEEVAKRINLPVEEAQALLFSAREKLFATREQRIHPGRDEKTLSSWNGLMISGMSRASRVFNRPEWLHSAQLALDFIRSTLWRDQQLLATYKDGKAHLNAYLDDHAFLLQALLDLIQSGYRSIDMIFAVQLGDALLERFEDQLNGGFFFTSHDHEKLIQRSKIGQDNATPSGNGIAAQALLRLSELTGNNVYTEAVERSLQLFSPTLQQHAGYHSSLCIALEECLQPASVLVLRGSTDAIRVWQDTLRLHYLPSVLAIALDEDVEDMPEVLSKPRMETITAWLCRGTQCLPPITSLDELLVQLR